MQKDFSEESLSSEGREQLVYAPPKLMVHGKVTELTASGSGQDFENKPGRGSGRKRI